jgi:hypothetical protein
VHPLYKFAVDAAKGRFPGDTVWGDIIENGQGYRVCVKRKGVMAAFQLRSRITVDGHEVTQDILNHGSNVFKALGQGFDNMEKSILMQQARMDQRYKSRFMERIKNLIFWLYDHVSYGDRKR